MFALFKKNTVSPAEDRLGSLTAPEIPHIDLSAFPSGIDNLRIDVTLSPAFVRLTRQLIEAILSEYGTGNKRVQEKPSPRLREQLNRFTAAYSSLLETATHYAKEGRRLDALRLFQIATIYFIQSAIRETCEHLINQFRADALHSSRGSQRAVELHERAARLSRQQTTLMAHSADLLFTQIRWVENSPAGGGLRESLLGVRWPLAECMLFNPLVIYHEKPPEEVQMLEYAILHQDSNHPYSFVKLDEFYNALLDHIATLAELFEEESLQDLLPEEFRFTWKDSLESIDFLFSSETTERALSWANDETEQSLLEAHLELQLQARQQLAKELRRAKLLPYISAAYYAAELYPAFAYALKPYMIFRALCGEMSLDLAIQKVELQQKLRKKPRAGDSWEPAALIAKSKREAARAAQDDSEELAVRFIRDFCRYRRDLQTQTILGDACERLHVLFDEEEIRLSQSNGMLQAFLQSDEYSEENTGTRGHVMLKADIRGSTTIVAELKKRDLNPATHFSLNFFQPINSLLELYGAEKVFIEGDAVILALFEDMTEPEHWFGVARACGLAVSMLQVVEEQNEVCRENRLPLLELGIGICYEAGAPTFLYDGDHRITISDAIGKADRLSSCSWALRRKFASRRMLAQVLVFEQPADAFKGEKGVTTLRYNLDGIELDAVAFEKLRGEITLQPLQATLPSVPDTVRLYTGQYPDTRGDMQQLLIREGRVRKWMHKGDVYPLTDKRYYEVMNPKILQRAAEGR